MQTQENEYMGGGGYGWGGGGILGIILVIALLGGNGFGFGRGHEGHERGDFNWLREGQFGLQKDTLENRYVSERNTGAIIHNQDLNTQKILDKMCMEKEWQLTRMLAEKDMIINRKDTVEAIYATLQPPRPIPAYQVPNPYAAYYPPYGERFDCGFGPVRG